MKAKPVDLPPIYNRLKTLLKRYEPPFSPKIDLDSRYDLWSFKKIEAFGKMRNEVYFAGLIIQSSYVGFYFMPVYAEADLKKYFGPELLKTLKGKSCFHIKYLDDTLISQIEQALEKGFSLYQERDWI
jgi:hypothetical protein